jgi:hypothetical protein
MSTWTGVVTTVVAICVAEISFLQWRTNREKLRFDLYEKRFQIYLRVLAFSQQILVWDNREDQVALEEPFFAAYRESKFMFPPESRVFDLLTEFYERAREVMHSSEIRENLREMPQERRKLDARRLEDPHWFEAKFLDIENQMLRYLKFYSV